MAYAILMTAVLLGIDYPARHQLGLPPTAANTILFFGLAAAQLVYVFNMTSPRTPLRHHDMLRNRYVWMALALWLGFIIITHCQLFMRQILGFSAITRNDLFLLLAPAGMVLGLGCLLGQLLGCRNAVAQPVVAQIGKSGSSREH